MRPLSFTTLAMLALALPAVASADPVILFPPTGEENEEFVDHVEEALADALIALGHQPMNESLAISAPPPGTGNEMRAVAEMERASWVIIPTVDGTASIYRLHLRVGQATDGRVEELEVTVVGAGEAERLRDVLGAMLRPEGVGDDAVRLTEEPDDAAAEAARAEEEARRLREEEEERAREAAAREEFEARERERAEDAERRQRQTWEDREQYGQRSTRWMLSAGVDVRPIVAAPAGATGGFIWGLSARLGYTIEDVDGLEIRAAIDGFGGSSSGFAIGAGAAYLHSFFQDFPLFLGLSVELGLFQPLTGNNSASFMLRAAPTVTWRVTSELHLEAAVAEVMYLSVGAATVGGALRVAYRF
jgi:hypothetical protein